MSNPTQLAPMIALYEDEGDFTLRVSDSTLAKSTSVALLKEIGAAHGARKLTLITPTDTKVFKFTAGAVNGTSPAPSPAATAAPTAARPIPPAQAQDQSAPPSPELVEYEAEIAEATRVQAEIDRENGKAVKFDEPTPEPAPARKRERAPRPAGTPTSCGRCSGAGTIQGGGTCPVCKGAGSVAKWGAGKR
jgi:hypothetical protein